MRVCYGKLDLRAMKKENVNISFRFIISRSNCTKIKPPTDALYCTDCLGFEATIYFCMCEFSLWVYFNSVYIIARKALNGHFSGLVILNIFHLCLCWLVFHVLFQWNYKYRIIILFKNIYLTVKIVINIHTKRRRVYWLQSHHSGVMAWGVSGGQLYIWLLLFLFQSGRKM